MRLISWNVNGLRSCLGKGFLDFCAFADADIICLQETKMRPEQAQFDLPGYHMFWNSADKAGYSGTAVFTRREPLSVTYDFGADIHRHEGRVITAEFEDFWLVCCYTPNSKDQLARLDYRMEWEDDLREYLLAGAGRQEAGGLLRRPERGAPGDRPEEPENQPAEPRLLRRGARQNDPAALQRLCGHLPRPVPGAHRRLLLVELYVQRPGQQRRVAH